jgi:hypothetical protein
MNNYPDLQNEQLDGVGNESVCETRKIEEEIILFLDRNLETVTVSPPMFYSQNGMQYVYIVLIISDLNNIFKKENKDF